MDGILTLKQKREYLQDVVSGGYGEIEGFIRECTEEEKNSPGSPRYCVRMCGMNCLVDSLEFAEMIANIGDLDI